MMLASHITVERAALHRCIYGTRVLACSLDQSALRVQIGRTIAALMAAMDLRELFRQGNR